MEALPGSRRVTGGLSIAAMGVIFFGSYSAYLLGNESYLQGPVWLLPLGMMLVGVLSVGLVFAGYWVAASEFSPEQEWRVTIWSFAGLIAALALTFWPIFYQRIVGVTIEDPVFILLVSSGLGANAGGVAGVSQVQSERQLHRVKQARDSLAFLNRLLRHNILNAVAIIVGNAEMIVTEGSASVAERARTIHDQGDRISDLIANTRVLVQRMERDDDLESVDLSGVVADEVATARRSYDGATVDADIESDVEVCADPLVSAVVENLVTNAVVHNNCERPRVAVTLETTEARAVLKVADDGPGFPDEDTAKLTDPGHHGDQGLGLYLVETLVSRYGGDLGFGANEPRGAVVTVELPLA